MQEHRIIERVDTMEIENIRDLLITTVLLILISGCYYDSEEELYPSTECNTDDVTYSGTVVPILEENCYESCHSKSASTSGITLEGYDNIIPYVNSGQLLGAIKHNPGFSQMPEGAPMLMDCTIAKIEQWIQEGAPDN